ncbi:MAG: flagellar assembly protein FliH [Spirochaetia bacterium]
MAKNVFRSNEVRYLNNKVFVSPPEKAAPTVSEIEEIEEYSGPTADDLRREAEEFKARWENEREAMISGAKTEAETIIKEAEEAAFEEVQKRNEEASETKQKAEAEAERIVGEARAEAEKIVKEAEEKKQRESEDARENALKEGREEGFREGREEAERLIQRLHVILDKAIQRRAEILEESEAQVVQLVLAIAKKVVKVISENQKNVVLNNIIQALRKLKSKSDIVIRVNIIDLKLTTQHTKEFMERIESVRNVTVLEDSTVDPGGCIIETDFGQIDARISSQLREMEERILDLLPIRMKEEEKPNKGS